MLRAGRHPPPEGGRGSGGEETGVGTGPNTDLAGRLPDL